MKRNIRNRTFIGLVLVMLLLAACTPAAATPTAAPTAAAGPVVVQYWSNGWFPSSIGARQAVVDSFNKEYEGRIKVEYVQGSWDDQATYVAGGAAAGGGIACLMDTDVGSAQDFFLKGYVQDLKPFLTDERR